MTVLTGETYEQLVLPLDDGAQDDGAQPRPFSAAAPRESLQSARSADHESPLWWLPWALCRSSDDPDLWHEPEQFEQARGVCLQCPVMRECAQTALLYAALPPHRISGLWAGVEVHEKAPSSVYRHRLKRLRFVAATGMQPPTRGRHRRNTAA